MCHVVLWSRDEENNYVETKWNIKWPLVNTCSAQQLRPSINQHVQVPLFSLLGAYHHLLPLINYALLLKFVFPTDRPTTQNQSSPMPHQLHPFRGGAVGGWHHHHLFTISFCSSPVVQLHFTTSVSNYYLLHICCTNNRQFLFMDM